MAQGICAITLKRKFQMKPFVLKQHARNAAAIRELEKNEVSAVAGGNPPAWPPYDPDNPGGGGGGIPHTYATKHTYFLGIHCDKHSVVAD